MIQRINVSTADNLLEHKHNTQFIFTVIIHKSLMMDFLLHTQMHLHFIRLKCTCAEKCGRIIMASYFI